MINQILVYKILFIATCISFSACLQVFQDFFIYWRPDFFTEVWRWWTAHWVHVGWVHYAFNMLAFACLPFIFPNIKNRYLVLLLLFLAPLMSLTFYYAMPHVEAYAGLSGVLHGLYAAVAVYSLQFSSERKFALLVLFLAIVKVSWENLVGSVQTVQLIGSPVLTEAHWIGLLWGATLAIFYLIFELSKRYFQKTSAE